MEFKDYYKIMDLPPEASQEDIKRAYRRLARKYHPDVSKENNAEAKFKELGEAYEVLKDKEKRQRYDTLRQQGWRGGESFRGPPNWQQEFHHGQPDAAEAGAFSDFFESLFGYRSRSDNSQAGYQRAVRGEDVYYLLEVDLIDSFKGATRKLEIPYTQITDTGQIIQNKRTINVKIPPGVVTGQHIRLKGQGAPGFNGPAGDLYLEIQLKDSAPYHVDGKDVSLILPVTPWEAALGAKIKTPSLAGNVEITVPPNSQTGNKLRLKGRGLPGDPPGDQYVTLQVVTPPATSPQAKELYQQMADKITFNPREKVGL